MRKYPFSRDKHYNWIKPLPPVQIVERKPGKRAPKPADDVTPWDGISGHGGYARGTAVANPGYRGRNRKG